MHLYTHDETPPYPSAREQDAGWQIAITDEAGLYTRQPTMKFPIARARMICAGPFPLIDAVRGFAKVCNQMPRKQMAISVASSIQSGANKKLYEDDYYSWARAQAGALRARRADNLDWDNLAEEVEDLANRNADALESQCERLIGHLLKIAAAPSQIRDENLRMWQLSVRDSRRKIRALLRKNPGLKPRANELFSEAWLGGRDQALAATGRPDEAITETCPWTFDQVMEESFEPRSL